MQIHKNQIIVLHEMIMYDPEKISDDTFISSYVFFDTIYEALRWMHSSTEKWKHRASLGYLEILFESPLFVAGEYGGRKKIPLNGRTLETALRELYEENKNVSFRISLVFKEDGAIQILELCSKFINDGRYI
jgi:hypothetical protein